MMALGLQTLLCLAILGATSVGIDMPDPVATVAKIKVSRIDLLERANAKLPYTSFHGNVSAEKRRELEKSELALLVDEELLFLEAQRSRLKVPADKVQSLMQAAEKKAGSRDELLKHQSKLGVSEAAYRRRFERQVAAEHLVDKLKSEIHVGDEQMLAHYQANKSTYVMPRSWQVLHALAKVDPSRLAESRKETKVRGDEILTKLRAGEDFFALGKQYPKDKFEDMGWVHESAATDVLKNALKDLAPGQVSEPVQTMYGYSIFKLVGVRQPQQLGFDLVKDAIRNKLVDDELQRRKTALLDQCRKRWPVKIYLPDLASK